jgi:hypothetical protein
VKAVLSLLVTCLTWEVHLSYSKLWNCSFPCRSLYRVWTYKYKMGRSQILNSSPGMRDLSELSGSLITVWRVCRLRQRPRSENTVDNLEYSEYAVVGNRQGVVPQLGNADGLATRYNKKNKDLHNSPCVMKCCTDCGFSAFGQGPVAESFEHDNETSGSVKGGEFNDSLNNC